METADGEPLEKFVYADAGSITWTGNAPCFALDGRSEITLFKRDNKEESGYFLAEVRGIGTTLQKTTLTLEIALLNKRLLASQDRDHYYSTCILPNYPALWQSKWDLSMGSGPGGDCGFSEKTTGNWNPGEAGDVVTRKGGGKDVPAKKRPGSSDDNTGQQRGGSGNDQRGPPPGSGGTGGGGGGGRRGGGTGRRKPHSANEDDSTESSAESEGEDKDKRRKRPRRSPFRESSLSSAEDVEPLNKSARAAGALNKMAFPGRKSTRGKKHKKQKGNGPVSLAKSGFLTAGQLENHEDSQDLTLLERQSDLDTDDERRDGENAEVTRVRKDSFRYKREFMRAENALKECNSPTIKQLVDFTIMQGREHDRRMGKTFLLVQELNDQVSALKKANTETMQLLTGLTLSLAPGVKNATLNSKTCCLKWTNPADVSYACKNHSPELADYLSTRLILKDPRYPAKMVRELFDPTFLGICLYTGPNGSTEDHTPYHRMGLRVYKLSCYFGVFASRMVHANAFLADKEKAMTQVRRVFENSMKMKRDIEIAKILDEALMEPPKPRSEAMALVIVNDMLTYAAFQDQERLDYGDEIKCLEFVAKYKPVVIRKAMEKKRKLPEPPAEITPRVLITACLQHRQTIRGFQEMAARVQRGEERQMMEDFDDF